MFSIAKNVHIFKADVLSNFFSSHRRTLSSSPDRVLSHRVAVFRQDALQGLRAAPPPRPAHLLRQLHPLLHHVRAHHL